MLSQVFQDAGVDCRSVTSDIGQIADDEADGANVPIPVRSAVFEAANEIEDHIAGAKVTTAVGLAAKVAVLHQWLTDGLFSGVPRLAASIAREARGIAPIEEAKA